VCRLDFILGSVGLIYSSISGGAYLSGFYTSEVSTLASFSPIADLNVALPAISELSRLAPTLLIDDLRDLMSADSSSSSDSSSLKPFWSDSTPLPISK
jgi:hypothetical protein